MYVYMYMCIYIYRERERERSVSLLQLPRGGPRAAQGRGADPLTLTLLFRLWYC